MTEYGKLVRDRIPEIIASDGRRPTVEVLTAADRRTALVAKLTEETAEVAAVDDAGLPEELGDVLEVLRALAADVGLSLDEVLVLADRKRASRGGFERGLLLVRVEEPGSA